LVEEVPQRQTGREMSTRRTVGKRETGTVNWRMTVLHTYIFRTDSHALENSVSMQTAVSDLN